MKKKIIFTLLFIIVLGTNSIAVYTSIPVWSKNNDTTEVNADTTADNFLNIESESAILIEQTTRRNSL